MGDDKSVKVDGDNRGIIITGDDNTVNQLHPHVIPKILTKQTGLANDIDFVGRKEELQKVNELLNKNSMLLLLNGIGGIGKSTLASYYLNQKKDAFDYYGFVQVNEDIKLSLVSAFGTSLDLKSEKIDDLFAEIMNKLHNLEGKKLLIIDDVKEIDSQLDEMETLITLKNSGFQILFTSREIKDSIPQYFLDIMSLDDARELFLKHYPTDEMDKVDKILEYLDYHTLFIEITAKTLTKQESVLSLDIVIEKFENKEFTTVKREKSESFNKFLKNFSHDSNMLTQEKNLLFLKRLSVLPSIEISFDDLYRFLVCEDKEILQDFVIELRENGWLIKSDSGYKFHQILKEFVFDNYLASFEEIEVQVDYFIKLVENNVDILVAMENKENIIYFDSLIKIFQRIDIKNEKVGIFFHAFGNIINYLGIYNKAKNFFQKALKIRKKLLGEEHSDTLSSYISLAVIYESIGDYDKAESISIKNLEISKKILGEEHLTTAIIYNNLALLYRLMGVYKKSELFYLKSLKIREKILGEKHLKTANSYHNLSVLYVSMGYFDKAEQLSKKSLKIRKNMLNKYHPNIGKSYNNLANIYLSMGIYDKAELFNLKMLKINEKTLGINHPETAVSYNNLATLYWLLGDYNKAERLNLKTLTIYKNLLKKNHPYIAQSYNNLALVYYSIGNYNKAKKFNLKAIKIREEVLDDNHPDIAQSYNNLAQVYYLLGDYDNTKKFNLKAIKIAEEVLDAKHPDMALYYNNAAQLYFSRKDYNKAEKFNLKAIKIREEIFEEGHLDMAESYNNLGLLYFSIRAYDKVELFYYKALKIYQNVCGENHLGRATVYNNLAVFYYKQKKYQDSYKYIEKAITIWEKNSPNNYPNLLQARESLKVIEKKLYSKNSIFNLFGLFK